MIPYQYLLIACFVVTFISGCQSAKPKTTLPLPVAQPVYYQPLPQGGQLSTDALHAASDRFGGSMPSDAAALGTPGAVSRNTVVLGPIYLENEEEPASQEMTDAGRQIREVISAGLSADGTLTLIDKPEERFKDDSPRPDLAADGVRFVVKGVRAYSDSTNEHIVFLRVVDTQTGEVELVASGRSASTEDAAGAATEQLLEKLKGVMEQ